MSVHQVSTQINIIGADKKSAIVFANVGVSPLPASAGQVVTTTKSATGSATVATHGTVSGSTVVFDSPA
jgi:hypothetical protein